ncbi:MAG: DUF6893 family small protein [Intrasporangium sp.]
MGRIIGWTLVAAAVAAVIEGLPDIRRYLKIRSM